MDQATKFEPLPTARHRIQMIDGAEWLVVPAGRNWFLLAFFAIWLTGWTIGAGTGLLAGVETGEPAGIAIGLSFLAFGWAVVGSSVLWQLAGRSLASVQDGALISRWSMPGFAKSRRYAAGQVRQLRNACSTWPFNAWTRSAYPPFLWMTGGSVQFDYGARTIRILPGVDEAEGKVMAEWLAKRLPAMALAS